MKKMIFAIALLLAVNCAVYAQANEQRRGGTRGAEMMKQRLKEELKFTDVKADSVTVIQQEFQLKNRELRTNSSMGDDQKKDRMEQNDAERKTRLKALLSEEEMKKLDAYMESMRKMRQERQQ
jgi:hypothetical protein